MSNIVTRGLLTGRLASLGVGMIAVIIASALATTASPGQSVGAPVSKKSEKVGTPNTVQGISPSVQAQMQRKAKCDKLLAAYKDSLLHGTGIQQKALREQISVLCGYSP
jgi:hypothetical protein